MLVQVKPPHHPLHHASVAIIGAGIGGLTLANALLYKNRSHNKSSVNYDGTNLYDGPQLNRITLYERAKHFVPTAGAGFGLSPNGQVCLSSIGLSTSTILHPLERMVRMDSNGVNIKSESNIFQQLHDEIGFTVGGCLRADLIDLLTRSFTTSSTMARTNDSSSTKSELKCEHDLKRITPVLDKVELEFSNGVEDVVDLVVGADGINSSVAKLLDIDHTEPTYAGANIIYGKIDNSDSIQFENSILNSDIADGTLINGAGTGELLVMSVGPSTRKIKTWATTYAAGQPPFKREEWDNIAGIDDSEGAKKEIEDTVLNQYPREHFIHELAAHTSPQNLLHFGLFYRQHKLSWFHKESYRVVLMGDACHATLPYIGQGANQAIEDAIVLADCLFDKTNKDLVETSVKQVGFHEAFERYYQLRFPRTKRIVDMCNFVNKLYHSDNVLVRWFCDFFLTQMTTGGLMYQQLVREIVDYCPVKDFHKYATPRASDESSSTSTS